jgi:hypothetical protein
VTGFGFMKQGATNLAFAAVGFEYRKSLAREGAVNGLAEQSVEL